MTSTVNLAGEFYVHDGYAGISEYIAVGLSRLGIRVNLLPFKTDRNGLSAELLRILEQSGPEVPGPLIFNSWVRPELDRFAGREHLVHTMWESSRLPDCWLEPLNRARALMVPTRFVADMFRASGIRVPIEITPDGVDPMVYPYVARPEREGITTLVVGTVVPRKHVPQAIRAWQLAFEDDPTARLVIKARFGEEGRAGLTVRDERITIVSENEPSRGILHWYEQADVLLALGSEGFGLPLIEGMATGLPVIALSSEGQGDVCADAADLVLAVPPAAWEDVFEPHLGHCGVRGVPDVREVARLLRWVADHRTEARALGLAASEWTHRERNIWRKPALFLDALEQHWPGP
ncbi:glycosyltransferase [Kitasatospora sp. NPDC057542]|uniref:glycosyltransferase n=1 Tax=Streptomycetaceae TaxID=2062 RepID=UPI001CCA912F|nr:glycosyltransferase [Streptomyces sp. LS1784]